MARLCAELAMLHRAKYRDYRRWRDGHRAWVQEYGMRPVPPTGAVILRIRPSVFIAPIVMEVTVIEPPAPGDDGYAPPAPARPACIAPELRAEAVTCGLAC
ncbi:MAG: hypothetical protein ACLPUO_11845 [Streptosporangiaceae bacterium]